MPDRSSGTLALQMAAPRPARAPRPGAPDLAGLAQRIRERTASVAVMGQGYVGFPLAQAAANAGFRTYGYDVSADTVARRERDNRALSYRAGADAGRLAEADVIVVAVPTPTRIDAQGRSPDLSYVIAALETVAATHRAQPKPRLVILESTYAPGTTRSLTPPLLDAAAETGAPLAVGYSPERIDPGNPDHAIDNTPKIVSGMDPETAEIVEHFYAAFIPRTARASSLEAAEAAKMLENAFRFVNITFAQEFDDYCEAVGINAQEITGLAATKPFGFMPFYAGAGIGGHCIAEDPYFLHRSMREAGAGTALLDAAMANHESRGETIVGRIARRIGPKRLADARIVLVGVTYKADVADTRMSPADPICRALHAAGAEIHYADPLVPEWHERPALDLAGANPADYDLAVVITKHSGTDTAMLREQGWRVYDTSAGPAPVRTAVHTGQI